MQVFAEIKPNYEFLDGLIIPKISNIAYENDVMVIVDMKEVFRKIFRPNLTDVENLSNTFVEEAASDVISIISHYRNYFYKNGKTSTFFFLYSDSECEVLKQKYPKYKSQMYEKYYAANSKIAHYKNLIWKAASLVIASVSNCFVIDTSKTDDVVALKYLIEKTSSKRPIIMLSNDALWFQGLVLNRPVYVMNCKGLTSELIDASIAMSYVCEEDCKYSINMLPLLLAITNQKRYSLYSFTGVGLKRAISVLNQLINTWVISDQHYLKLPQIPGNINIHKSVSEHLPELYLKYDIITGNELLITHKAELFAMFNCPNNIRPYSFFTDLNAKLFINYPISIDLLFKGES